MLLENPFAEPFTLLGWTGSGFPVYAIAGGEETETEVEVELDDEAEVESEEAAEGDDEEKTKLREALKKANGQARDYRLKLRAAQQKAAETAVEEVEAEAQDKGTEPTAAQLKRAIDKAKKDAAAEAEAKYRPVAIHAAAESAFVTAGAKSAGVAKLVRLLDTEDIEIDMATGKVVAGLDEQIDTLKDEFPELFSPAEPAKAKRPAVKRAAAAPRQEAEPQALSSAEKMAASILGR